MNTSITDYELLEHISEGRSAVVMRARKNDRNVIIKLARQDSTRDQFNRLRREFELLSRLRDARVIRALDLIEGDGLALVLEDIGGESLARLMRRGLPDLPTCLDIACKMAEALESVHQRRVIHKDISPANVVRNDAGELRLIDFGVAAALSRETPSIRNPNVLEGTLAYMAPEQTGRMNRPVDYRSDLYGMGATLYHLMTGAAPFESTAKDRMELVHSHIARMPRSPMELRPEIPPALSKILLKLLAKSAEDRYQSATGLRLDLQRCKEESKNGILSDFEPGLEDFSDRFHIPDRFYGRDTESRQLLEVFERTQKNRPQLLLVGGYSGIGKTALIQEVHRPIVARRGYFIQGKFDQFNRSAPYASVAQAFADFIRQVLSGEEDEISHWRNRLSEALDANSAVLAEVIPELKLLLGPQPEPMRLPSAEAENRFFRAMQNLLRNMAADQPIVLFLDDLQRADPPSLKLLSFLLSDPEGRNTLIIGAYRDNEVDDAHPLMLETRELEKEGVPLERITLGPLLSADITTLVADTLNQSADDVRGLAEIVTGKTRGNPFFINQFLKALYEEGLLEFDSSHRKWAYFEEAVQSREMTENVVELVAGKIKRLAPDTVEMLKLASCAGSRFNLTEIATMASIGVEEAARHLWPAMEEELIIPLSEDYKFVASIDEELAASIRYAFVHDRVQQAAYDLLDDKERAAIHLALGTGLLEKTGLKNLESNDLVYEVTNHLIQGLSLSEAPEARLIIAQCTLYAARRARNSAAYLPAFGYAMEGLRILGEQETAFQSHYKLAMGLHIVGAEVSLLTGNQERMEELCAKALENCKDLLEKAQIEEIRILALMSTNRPLEAIALALPILKALGVRLPSKPTMGHILAGLARTKARMAGKDRKYLAGLPAMTDKHKLAAMNLLARIQSSAYFAMPNLYPLIVYAYLRLSLKYGNTGISTLGYASYGVVHAGILLDFDSALKYGEVAYDVMDQYPSDEVRTKGIFFVEGFIRSWRSDYSAQARKLQEAYRLGLDTGDHEFAAHSAFMSSYYLFFSGRSLEETEREMAAFARGIHRLKQASPEFLQHILYQATRNFRTVLDRPWDLDGEIYNEEIERPKHEAANDKSVLFTLYVTRLLLAVYFRNFEKARELAGLAQPYMEGGLGTTYVPLFYFLDSVAWLQGPNRLQGLRRARKNQRKLRKWKKGSPRYFSPMYLLVQAEIARVQKSEVQAAQYYEQALEEIGGHVPMQALASEMAARFYLGSGQRRAAEGLLTIARAAYERWGAESKAKALLKEFPTIRGAIRTQSVTSTSATTVDTSSSGSDTGSQLDLDSVLKASRAISGEIVLSRLLERLMEILIESAGATRGALLLASDDEQLFVHARGSVEKRSEGESTRTSIEDSDNAPEPLVQSNLPAQAIQYCARIRETISFDEKNRSDPFQSDANFQIRKPRSAMAAPLVDQGRLRGIVYLENDLAAGAFTPDRVELVAMLASQAAVSIDNARLYQNLEVINHSYSRFVPHEFLRLLEKDSIVDVHLGDQVQREMSVLFMDIRSFTTLSETMTPQENFNFVNGFLGRMEPSIRQHKGFIDKYIGDAIMALFPGGADDAVQAVLDMMQQLEDYNRQRVEMGQIPIAVGAGLNSGLLMLGTIGGPNRMEGTVISDTVNVASRLESLTKMYRTPVLLSGKTVSALNNRERFRVRRIDRVRVRGKKGNEEIFEFLDALPAPLRDRRMGTRQLLESGLVAFQSADFDGAESIFNQILSADDTDGVARLYLDRCADLKTRRPPKDWDGVSDLELTY